MYRRPDGLFEKKLTIGGKRVVFRAGSEREVMQKIAAYQERAERGPTFEEVAGEWWAYKQPRLSPNTVPGYRLAMERAIDRFGDKPAKEITPSMVKAYLDALAHRGYARRTVSQHLIVLREICAWACENYDAASNPAALVKLPDGLRKGKRTMPTQAQIDAIKASVGSKDGLFLYFLMYTGLRLGEALALRWEDIDAAGSMIHVQRSLYFAGQNQGQLKQPKTEAGTRSVLYMERLKAVLEPHRGAAGAYVFGGDRPMTKRGYYCLLDRCRKAGIDVTPHQLRHAFATLCFEAGIPEKTAQGMLGHAQLSTTMDIYAELRQKKLFEAAAALNAADL